jgi:DNA-cytosine methyltransferase
MINKLSLFNGMSFGAMALESLGVEVGKRYSSEIDKYANQATQALFPGTIQLGDITNWREWDIDWASIDLVTGGFPCQPWSPAGNQLADKDERGMLFWFLLDIIKHIKHYNPKVNFLIENVKMKKEFEQYITTHTENALGHVHKILIDSALVSAQNRKRYYWTNFKVEQPEDKGIVLADIVEYGTCDATVMSDKFSSRQKGRKCLVDEPKDKAVNLCANEYVKNGRQGDYIKCNSSGEQEIFNLADNNRVAGVTENDRGFSPHRGDDRKTGLSEIGRILKEGAEKTDTVTCSHAPKVLIKQKPRGNNPGGDRALDGKTPCMSANSWQDNNHLSDGLYYRKLTPRECFRLQTVPEHHIDTLLSAGISNTQLYKMCGNGWTMEVIAHIFKSIILK